MKKLISIVLLIAMLLCFVACGSKSIVGTWTFGVNTFEFRDDNTVSISINGMLNYNGTYVVEDNTITITTQNILGMSVTKDFEYSLSGKTLTITGDVMFTGSNMSLELQKQK